MAERHGIPALGVMTTQFVSAAKLMSRVLGIPDYPFAIIAHPVSSASDARLRELAADTIEPLRAILLAH